MRENWLVLSNMTWGIIASFHQSTFESLKIQSMMGSFYPKSKLYELKIYRGVLCHDNEELYQIWTGIDLSVQNWHDAFHKFWSEYSKISKICTLTGCFWPKHIMFELKKYSRVMFDGTEDWCKIWMKTDFCFQKIFVCRLKNGNFILESKMAELS